MALSGRDYAADARNAGLNVYWVAEGDREGDIRLYAVTAANPCCNCYSVAKAFTVTAGCPLGISGKSLLNTG